MLQDGRQRANVSPEAQQFAALARQFAHGNIPLDEVVAQLDNRNVPPQLKQVPFSVTLASASDTPKLLIKENKNRMGFLLAYTDTALTGGVVLFSYGGRPAPNVGIPLVDGVPYGESNGTVSINDIYIYPFNVGANPATYPLTVIGYEGTLAIESHLHVQTARSSL
jgi:hypothetical protein